MKNTATANDKKLFGVIRNGDMFRDRENREWRCINVLPGGKLDMFCDAKSLFAILRHAYVRENFARI